ncbi:hypothetical protein KY338_00905 [Candidatus Woesearchaeota archaeon]|nr:hypothetical protein [Candidatus Woesearchaeota archaeon]MBW3006156.1 hypothetical protein [Candidatus Woesearchaeota archaeon]
MSKRTVAILVVIFAIVLAARLYFAFSIPSFSSDDSYFHLRQIEHIRDTGLPIFEDDLSFSGRTYIFSPVFHYLIAFFALFLPVIFAAKLVTNILAASLIFFIYLIAKKLTNNSFVALTTAFLSGFVPVFFADTVTELTPISIVIPLMFLLVYALMNIKKKPWLYCYLSLLVVLTLMHPLILLFVLGLFIYIALILIEKLKQNREEWEISLFSIFFVVWAYFIMYKKLLVFHGPAVIWQNIPPEILNTYFAEASILGVIYNIGIMPFVLGLYIIYLFSFKKKDREIYLIISFAAAAGLLLWLRLINLNIGLMFFGIVLVILFAQWFYYFIGYVQQSRVSNFLYLFMGLIFAGLIVFSVYPSVAMALNNAQAVSPEELSALNWINENTPMDAVIIAGPDEGNLITAVAERSNVLDSRFLLQNDAKQRFADVKRIYTACLEIEVISLLDKYDAEYIYFSDNAKELFDKEELSYVGKCFEKVYDTDVQIYQRKGCELTVVK